MREALRGLPGKYVVVTVGGKAYILMEGERTNTLIGREVLGTPVSYDDWKDNSVLVIDIESNTIESNRFF